MIQFAYSIDFQNYMEKRSEKIIGSNKVSSNPFNNLLSEVQIKINQPKSSKKIDNYALQIDPNIDKSNSNFNSEQQAPFKKENNLEIYSKFAHQNNYSINIPLKTKNSSDTPNRQKSQKDIIDQWIVGYMAKRHILGLHWEQNFIEKKRQLLYVSFQKMKQYYKQDIIDEKSLPEKIQKLNKSYQKLQNNNLRLFFTILKDDLLFGLSNTLGQERDHSFMLKTDSDYESLGVQSKNFKKQAQNKKNQEYSFSDHSQSNKNLTKKASQSVSASEDLSNLILNHNKLKIQEQLNKSVPNIPKNKTSQRSINTHKEICELSIETKKQIVTQKKLSDDNKIQGLPLQSNTNLIHTKKQLNEEKQIKAEKKEDQEKKPVTITFIINNLNNNSLIKHQKQSNIQQHSKIQHKQNSLQIPLSDQNIINKLPFAESFYQQAPGNNKRIHFIQKIQHQKRSNSLQIKPGYVPLFPEAVEPNISMKRIFANEYYPEQPSRQNAHFFKQSIPLNMQKARPKSATPRITFTFTSNTAQNMDIHANIVNNKLIQKRVINPINNHYPYEHQDHILQSILHPHFHEIVKPIITHERIKHKLQVISPPRKIQSPKRHHPPNKMALDNRQHIKNNLLPPISNEYGIQSSQRNLKSQKSGGKLMFMENQIIYSDNFQKSTAQNSYFACSGRQSGYNYQVRQETHMKSPNDKIFVTYANPCNL